MGKESFYKSLAVALVIVVVAVMFVAIFIRPPTPKILYSEEIRDYQGENLSSISGMVDNSIKGPQNINVSTYRLEVMGLVNQTTYFTYDQVLGMFQSYQKVVTLHCVDGWSVNILWQGFLVSDLLKAAGADPAATTVIFYAADGYSTALPIDYLTSNNILIAYKMNGITLPPERGFPLQLVAESQYGYKWIKWITKIEVSGDSSYLGYWESHGYANNATIPKPPASP